MGLWTLLGVIAWITKYFPGKYNNFSIFRQSFWHTLNELPLYAAYPEEYNDIFHYGPVFSLVVAPFAITPLWLGLLTWSVAQSLFLFWAVKMLPGIKRERIFIYWFCAHELLTSLFMSQFNISIAAIIVLAYALIEKEKDVWAAFVIMLGTFTKLYGITGLAFFFFSRHKMKFSLSCVGWAVIMVVAPMILSGPDYIMSQYTGWFEDLSGKNSENLFALMQNISFLGMVRKISGSVSYSDIYLIIGGLIVFGLPYLRISQYKYEAFRKTLLASVTPIVRFPLFWLAYHNLPATLYRKLALWTWKEDGYFLTYFHPWEFTSLSDRKELKLPFIMTNHSGCGMERRLDALIRFFKDKRAPFGTYTQFSQEILSKSHGQE